MGNKRVLALHKQFKREQRHVVWLEQHLPNSRQLNSARQRIAELCMLECVVETATLPTLSATTKKSDAEAPLSLFNLSRFRLEVEGQTYNCELLVVYSCEDVRTVAEIV